MLVGEAPGADEDERGRPFVGESGGILDTILAQVGLRRQDVYIANAVKCRPPGNRDPHAAELAACWSYLAEEIMAVRPKAIITLGTYPLKVLTGQNTIKSTRGKPVPPAKHVRVGDAIIIPSYHPAAYLHQGRNPAILKAIREDFELALLMIGETQHKLPKHEKILLQPDASYQELEDALVKLKDCPKIAVDCEWTANAWTEKKESHWPWTPGAELYSISFSGRISPTEVLSVATAWPMCNGSSKALDLVQRFFDTRRQLIFHNAMSDLIWLTAVGFVLRATDDTQFLGYLLNEEQRLNLDRLAPKYAAIPSGWKQLLWPKRPQTARGWTELLDYNSDDTFATLLLLDGEIADVRKRPKDEQANIARAYQRLLIPALPMFVEMALEGAPINRDRLTKAIREHKTKAAGVIAEFAGATGMRVDAAERVVNSPEQLKAFLEKTYRITLPDTQAQTLEQFADQFPIIGLTTVIKHERKLTGTYLVPWEELTRRQLDDRLHSVYRLDKTRTGRTSASVEKGGSIQLAPREEWLRDLVDADEHDEGEYTLLGGDYSQAELRMIAWLAPEHTMRQLYNEGADLHRATAAFIKTFATEHLSVEEFWARRNEFMAQVTGEERQRAKGINFGLDFGMQPPKFVSYAWNNYHVRFTLEEAVLAHEGYFKLYHDLGDWHLRCESDLAAGKPVITPFGRYRRGITEVTQQINTPIQTTANDLAIFAGSHFFNTIAEGYDSEVVQFVGFIHDSILLRVRRHRLAEIRTLFKHAMENPPLDLVDIEIPVPIIFDVKDGKTWATAH